MMNSMLIMMAFAGVLLIAGVIGRGLTRFRGWRWRIAVTVVLGSGAIVWAGLLLPGLNAERGTPPEVAGALAGTVLGAIGGIGCLWLPVRRKGTAARAPNIPPAGEGS